LLLPEDASWNCEKNRVGLVQVAGEDGGAATTIVVGVETAVTGMPKRLDA
jgi:hypothetical protein